MINMEKTTNNQELYYETHCIVEFLKCLFVCCSTLNYYLL